MLRFCKNKYCFKTALTFVFAAIVTIASAQSKYKRTYTLKNIDFKHVAAFPSGNAIIFIDRDSLINYLLYIAENPGYYESSVEKIQRTVDTILVLSKKSDITNIESVAGDPEVTGIILSYYSRCLLNKRANVFNKKTNEYVKKIIVKKSDRSSRSFSSYSWYYYFLPNDKKEFMHRVEKTGTGIKFL